jgi:hypothetical protein
MNVREKEGKASANSNKHLVRQVSRYVKYWLNSVLLSGGEGGGQGQSLRDRRSEMGSFMSRFKLRNSLIEMFVIENRLTRWRQING